MLTVLQHAAGREAVGRADVTPPMVVIDTLARGGSPSLHQRQ